MKSKNQKQMTESKDNKVNIGNQKDCKCCFQQIHISAKVCNHCSRHQNFWARHFGDTAIVVSIVMVILATAQFLDTRKKNIDASSALTKAKSAAEDVNEIRIEANIIKDEINFNLLLTKASNYDRASFFRLHDLAITDNRFQKDAKQTIEQIITRP